MEKRKYVRKLVKETVGKSKIYPHSLEAEESIIAALIKDNNLYDKIKKYCGNSNVFYFQRHKIAFQIIKKLIEEHVTADVVTVLDKVQNKDQDIITGYWLTGITSDLHTSANIESHAKIVYQKYRTRQIIRKASSVQKNASKDASSYKNILEEVRSLSDEFLDGEAFHEFDIAECAKETIESIQNSDSLIKFGFNHLDGMAGGMTPGEITVIAGRPGHGKTTFAMNLIKNLLEQDKKVMVVNREMTNTEMMKKLMVNLSSDLSYSSVRLGNITDKAAKEMDAVINFIKTDYKNRLMMFDNITDMAETVSAISQYRPDVIIDDYIQLIRVPDMDARRFEIESIMQEYKWMAKKYKCVPILVSQLNRDIERRIDPIPKMSDLAEGSSIEQIAENVIFVYYDYKVNYDNSQIGKDQSQLVAAKVRYGNSGIFTVGFDGDRARFVDKTVSLSKEKIKEPLQMKF